MRHIIRQCIFVGMVLAVGGGSRAASAPEPRTAGEQSGFKATATYAQAVEFGRALAGLSPKVREARLGTTQEGRAIPLLVLADPPVASAEEAARSGKLVVLLLGTMHGGEVCGKEAFLALVRDLALENPPRFLDRLVIVAAPLLNPDGAERIATANRPVQRGPEGGVGIRENARGLDLNRDFVKLEAPETRALARFLTEWDPAVVIDAHTTESSRHRHPLSYASLSHPAGDADLAGFVREKLLPAIAATLRTDKGLDAIPYGNFDADRARWTGAQPFPRYGITYVGLRNRIALFAETYADTPFEARVRATYDFAATALAHAAAQADEIRRLCAAADRAATEAGRKPEQGAHRVAVRTRAAGASGKVVVKGLVEELREGVRVATDAPKDYEVELCDRFEAEREVERPYAYFFPAAYVDVIENLQRHGLEVETLREDVELDAQRYAIASVTRAERPSEGHTRADVAVQARDASTRVDAGTILVRTGQKLGTLAALLLEPASEDGLAAWNFFDNALEAGKDFPVVRLPGPAPLVACRVRPLPEDLEPPKPVTFKALRESDDPPRLGGTHVGGMRWLRDGEHFLHPREGTVWKIHAATGRAGPFFQPKAIADAFARLPWLARRDADDLANQTPWRMDPLERGALYTFGADLYYCDLGGASARRLTSSPAAEEFAEFSPDGKFVAYVSEYDLWVVDVATATPRRLTTGGHAKCRNGKADWVYYEEVFNRRWKTFWWSPDSRVLGFLQIDSSPVTEFAIVNNLESAQSVGREAFPKPGTPNPRVRVGIVEVAGNSPRWADLSAYAPEDTLVTGMVWARGGERLCFFVQDRLQTWLDVCAVTPHGAKPVRVLRDSTRAWIEAPQTMRFLADGSFLLTSERTGWQHVYHYGPDGALRAAVTAGEWEVRDVVHVDEDGRWVYFTGTRDSPIAHNLYRARLDGSALERVTTSSGHHSIGMSPTGSYFIDTWSSHVQPEKVALCRPDGARVRTLDTNPLHEAARWRLGAVTLHTIPAADGFPLESMLITPHDFSPEKKYPVWFSTYAGPHAQTVWDSWGGGRAWEHMLAQSGIVSFHCDVRSASGKGAVSAWSAYRQLGVGEMKDIEAAVKWLCAHPHIDATRIGIEGFSYGGFMTAYALTHSTLFASGIAGGAVTDWEDYDSIYTERYMRTPQDNPEGYAASSVVAAAGNLHGRLLIMHGGLDDNVHLQHATRLMLALQRAGKRFELMIYPDAGHGIGGIHYDRMMYEFIRTSLGAEAGGQWRVD